jgi:hypothetical protein
MKNAIRMIDFLTVSCMIALPISIFAALLFWHDPPKVNAQTSTPPPIYNTNITGKVSLVQTPVLITWMYVSNPAATRCSLDFFNAATASVTLGTTQPAFSVDLPATSVTPLALPRPMFFNNQLSAAANTLPGGNVACGTGMVLQAAEN